MPKKDNDWKRQRRIEHFEQKQEWYYIFCEGKQTEPLYFKGFQKVIEENPIYKNMILVDIVPCGLETVRIVEKAQEFVEESRIKKGQVWCVYDKDSFPPADFNRVEELIESLNAQKGDIKYHAAWSNECIEFWFLLHFSRYTSNNSRKEYQKFLNEKFQKSGLGKYRKNREDIFQILAKFGNPKMAIKYAKQIIENNEGKAPSDIAPGTRVYELVEELAKYFPQEIKEIFTDD